MTIAVYSKLGCGKCAAAKEKIRMMNMEYQEHDIEYHIRLHDGWREDGSVEVLSAYHGMDTLPLIRINSRFYDYAGAMSELKKRLREREGQTAPAPVSINTVAEVVAIA